MQDPETEFEFTDMIGEEEPTSEADVQAVMEKYDRESNVRIWDGMPRIVVRYMLVAFAIYSILLNFGIDWETRIERASFVGILVFLTFIVFPARKGSHKKKNYIPWYDVILALLGGGSYFYFVFNLDKIIANTIRLEPIDLVIGIIGVVVTLEACRRAVGIPIVIVSSLFIIYMVFFTKAPLALNVYNLFYTTEGVIGTPIRACSTFIVLFVIFGAFLERTGISQFFIELANSIAGSSSGGPAKVAVISSALCGMVSGSSVGNTVTTGSVTIPMMKKNGFRPEFAGAVEAASSTGGQIMPPIMGAAAFLMVEYTGFDYGYIAVRAILPAVLYFSGIFIAVHLEAKRMGLKGLSREELPKFLPLILKKGYLLLPLILLVVMMMKTTMSKAAIIATAVAIVVSMFNKDTRMNLTKFFDALENGARSTLTVGVACAVAGTIACVITTTGIGAKLISAIVGLSGGVTIIAMFLTMLTCIVLGMGVPTTANYVIMATTCAPILIKMGLAPLAAHMFVFYFGIVADITPPVALAAYAGSAIAKSRPMKTAVTATTLAIAAFIVPYCFGLNPALLFIDATILGSIQVIVTALLGVFGVAAGLRGYIFSNLRVWQRLVVIAGGLVLVYPGTLTDIIGIVLVIGICALSKMGGKKKAAEA
ncbi:MAG: TRAP transporter permease [Ruminiclostridium sp.]|nr:TRAP transporter permease [Ruminiclostridium sp.]